MIERVAAPETSAISHAAASLPRLEDELWLRQLDPHKRFAILAASACLLMTLAVLLFPETRGLDLDAIDQFPASSLWPLLFWLSFPKRICAFDHHGAQTL